MKFCYALCFFFFIPFSMLADWSPVGLLFRPLTANVIEPRVGGFYQFEDNRLRLDIGSSLDIYAFPAPSQSTEIRLGADFMTYSRLRSEGRMKFPVETTDFYFGFNSSMKFYEENCAYSVRVRLAHISSHIVDGYFGQKEPFVYSREFLDVIGAVEWDYLRVYAGGNILFAKQPRHIFGFIAPQIGADFSIPLAEHFTLQAGYDLHLPTIHGEIFGVNSAQLGLKIGERFGKGISLNGYWYNGKSFHGMFYDEFDSYLGLGFQVEL